MAIRSPPGRRWWTPPSARRRTTRAARSNFAPADARQALARDPEHVDGHVQLALALGHLDELNGPVETHPQGYAREGRRHLDRALELDPDQPGRTARSGCGTSRSCGTQALRSPVNSTVQRSKKGLAHCVLALELAPKSIGLRFGCGVSLLAVGRGAYGRQAAELLCAALRLPPRDAAERLVQRRAQRLLGEADGCSDRTRSGYARRRPDLVKPPDDGAQLLGVTALRPCGARDRLNKSGPFQDWACRGTHAPKVRRWAQR